MPAFLCEACGTRYAPTVAPPPACLVCEDERQFVPPHGQRWTTLEALAGSHAYAVRRQGELLGIGTTPSFGIGQRALLVQTPAGNVLWDCISLVDPLAVELIGGLGGLAAVAISHPHFYASMREWGRAFGVPVHLHARDRAWVMDPGPELAFWDGDARELLPGVTLLRVGGHFPGGTVLHWAAGAAGRGALLAGDLIQVNPDRRSVSFMRSYPNFLPLGAAPVQAIADAMAFHRFEAIYGPFFDRVILDGARHVFDRSVARYLAALAGGVE